MSQSTIHLENAANDLVAQRVCRALQDEEGRPALPVLVGSFAQCWSTWRHVAETNDMTPALLRPTDSADLFSVWLKHLQSTTNLTETTISALCRDTDLKPDTIRRQLPLMSRARCRQLLQQSGVTAKPTTHAVLKSILDAARNRQIVSAQELLETIAQTVPDGEDATTAVIRAVIDIAGASAGPAMLCCGAFPSDDVNDKTAAALWLKTIVDLSVAVPAMKLGLTATVAEFDIYSAGAHDSFRKAVAHDNVMRLCETSKDVVRQQIKTTLINHPATRQTLDAEALDNVSKVLAEQPNSGQLAEAAIALVTLQSVENSPDDLNDARSRAEAFLFALLDQRMETAGLFKLNQKMEFRFGSKPAELDLSAIDLKIAIEVDGYFHFHDNDGYRRDRRKDILLQQQGFVVMRVLAEDVVPQMSEIVDAIIRTVKWRRVQFHKVMEATSVLQSRKPR